jgi:hypothetical protein
MKAELLKELRKQEFEEVIKTDHRIKSIKKKAPSAMRMGDEAKEVEY